MSAATIFDPAPASQVQTSTFVLVDGHSLAFRSYYAFTRSREGGLRTSQGVPTSVCYGFLKALLEVIDSEKPQYLAVAFDLSLPTFRHDADDTYKEGRPEVPEDFIPDLKKLQQLLNAFNLPVLTAPGYEADDVIGTLAKRASSSGFQVKILSGDQDLFQLIDTDQGISVLHLSSTFAQRGNAARPREFGPEQVKQKLGILPSQVVDYKALCGDSSDNIPGVKGIGAKTAVQLLEEYGSLEQVYASLDQIKGAVKQKLEVGKDAARHSQYLAQLALNVPLEIDLEACRLQGFDQGALVPILEELEFESFLGKIAQLQRAFGGSSIEAVTPRPDPAVSRDEDLWFFSASDTEAAQQQVEIAIAPQIIDTPSKLAELVKLLQTRTDPAVPVAWDTETNSLSPRDAKLVGIGCCWGASTDEMAYIPTGHAAGGNLDTETVLARLRPILEDVRYPKVLQNAKFDRLVFHFQGIELAGVVFDTMLASYVLNPDGKHNLSELATQYLEIKTSSYTDLVKKGQTIADLDIPAVANYCGMDVYTTFHLLPELRRQLETTPALHRLLLEVEQPLEPVLALMETWGIRIDQAYLKELSEILEKDLHALEESAYAIAGEKFNLGSPKQLSKILFEDRLDPKKSRKTKLGYSTDAATLEKFRGEDPLVDTILEYRTLAKLKSTYVDALPTLVHPQTQRVHSDFNQAITSTGRLSSSNPNLQNIPIRTTFSRQIRAAFVPEPGWLLVTADYSQIELRILAHLSQEPKLVEAYKNQQDVHTLTAQLLLEKEIITPEERRLAKIINFGVIYGMGAQRFAREARASYAEGKRFIERFYERYPGIFAYLKRMEAQAIAQGYVETTMGRRRYFNFDSPSLRQLRGKDLEKIEAMDLTQLKVSNYDRGLLRAAANAPIQGSSADIIKVAMVRLHEVLRPCQARLLLQVHDELVLEIPPTEWEALRPEIQSTMEQAASLSIPLVADIHAGKNWMEAK